MKLLPLAARADHLTGSVIDSSTELLAAQTHDIVRFAMGAPSEDLLPVAELDHAFSRSSRGRYDYGESAGEPRLREEILKLSHQMGVTTSDDRLVVTNGAMQGLDLAFKLLVDPGDLVIVENPTYPNGYQTAKSYEARVIAAPVDDNGLVVEALPELVESAGATPKVIYTIPNFQNPTGVTLSRERKIRLLELAERWGSVIVEDDPYGMLRFDGQSVPSFSELSPDNPLIFRIQTFSKLIAPGLRVGWIDVDPTLQKLAVNAKQAMDTCTNAPNQFAVAEFLAAGHLGPHLDRLLPLYQERKGAMIEAVRDTFGDAMTYTQPEGGFFLWATFEKGLRHIDTQKLFPLALAAGVAYIPGAAFTIDNSMNNALRLCFATSSPERIREGMSRLQQSVHHASLV
jgi:2-aminoadipate transaminase